MQDLSVKSPSPSPTRIQAKWCAALGASVGLAFSSPGGDLAFDVPLLQQWLLGALWTAVGMAVLFGLPAGVILGWLDRRRGNAKGWLAIIKVPTTIAGGFLLLFVILAIPFAIDVLARSGSEQFAGAEGNTVLRRVIGTLVGACFGMAFAPLLVVVEQWNKWMYAKLPDSPSEPAEPSDRSHGRGT